MIRNHNLLSGVASAVGPFSRGRLWAAHGAYGGFSLASLFAASEQGVWYDPSDKANRDWRRNLLTYTEQFDNAAWTAGNATISPNAAVAPDGTTTADKVVENTAAARHDVIHSISSGSSGVKTVSVYAKPAGRSAINIFFSTGETVGDAFAVFDLQNGLVHHQSSAGIASITAAEGGFYRCSITVTFNAAINTPFIALRDSLGTNRLPSHTGDGTSGILLWGAQLEAGTTATDYQKITDVFTETRERFPSATLYQDSAGTQPAASPGDVVGLMLDKSQGLVRGPELVTNGGFDDATGWTLSNGGSGTVDITGGKLVVTSAANGALADRTMNATLLAGRAYEVTCTIDSISGGGARFSNRVSIGLTRTSPGTYTEIFIGSTDRTTGGFQFTTTGVSAVIDNISVKEILGNHATQATTASKPILARHPVGGRRNLLTYTEDFGNAAWTKFDVSTTPNGAVDPDGGETATIITVTTATTGTGVRQTVAGVSETVAFGFYIKRVSGSGFSISYGTENRANYSSVTPTDEWQFVETSKAAAGDVRLEFASATAGDAVAVWHPQLETGSTATAYQKVVSQYNVTEAGKDDLWRLTFDGFDDFLQTGSINFTSTDEMTVIAGVRTLAASNGNIVSTNDSSTLAAGTFFFRTQTAGNEQIAFAGTGGDSRPTFPITPPSTYVVTGLSDLGAGSGSLRKNGSSQGAVTASGGNFANRPMFIGRRDGGTIPFNGHIYGLVVRGALTAGDTLTKAETAMNAKTGAY